MPCPTSTIRAQPFRRDCIRRLPVAVFSIHRNFPRRFSRIGVRLLRRTCHDADGAGSPEVTHKRQADHIGGEDPGRDGSRSFRRPDTTQRRQSFLAGERKNSIGLGPSNSEKDRRCSETNGTPCACPTQQTAFAISWVWSSVTGVRSLWMRRPKQGPGSQTDRKSLWDCALTSTRERLERQSRIGSGRSHHRLGWRSPFENGMAALLSIL
jgi:hypothetical protein